MQIMRRQITINGVDQSVSDVVGGLGSSLQVVKDLFVVILGGRVVGRVRAVQTQGQKLKDHADELDGRVS